jgi:glycosyltransferase involved in cell wall biosynthesis
LKKLLWFLEKEFDVSSDVATWLEIIRHLHTKYRICLVSGYRHGKIYPESAKCNLIYYNSLNVPVLNRITTYFSQIYRFYSITRSFQPNVLLFNTSNPVLLRIARRFQNGSQALVILDVRTLPVSPNRFRRIIETLLLKENLRYASLQFDGITYITCEMRRFCAKEYRLASHRSAIWSSGVDTSLFCTSGPVSDGKNFKIMYHGSGSKNRGLENIIKALALTTHLNIHLDLLTDNSAIIRLRKVARRYGVSDKVAFYEPIEHLLVPKWISERDIGVLPFPHFTGWNTSSPIKLFEYLSCEKPVIATKIPAHINVLQDYPFVFWADTNSPDSLAKALSAAVAAKDKLELLGKQARSFVTTYYTWKNQASALQSFIESI